MPGAEDELRAAVVDASVVVRWLVEERGSEQAAALLERDIGWVAPRLVLTEVAGALRRKVIGGELSAMAAIEKLQTLLDYIDNATIRLADDERIMASALTVSLSIRHGVAGCVYVALADREGIGLVTADAALGRVAEQQGVPTVVVPSA